MFTVHQVAGQIRIQNRGDVLLDIPLSADGYSAVHAFAEALNNATPTTDPAPAPVPEPVVSARRGAR